MAETVTVLIKEKGLGVSGDGQFGPWQLYYALDGNDVRYSTFKEKIFDQIVEHKQNELEIERTDKGINILSAKAVAELETPKLGTGEYITGKKSDVDAMRILISNASNQASALTVGVAPGGITIEETKALWDAMFWHVLGITRGAAGMPEEFPF